MARRKAKPSGQLNGDLLKAIDAKSPAATRRALDSALRSVSAPEYGSEIGRLFLANVVDATEHAAAKKWAQISQSYAAALVAPKLGVMKLERGSRSNGHTPTQAETTHDVAVVEAMSAALAALAASGQHVARITARLVEQDGRPAGIYELEALKRGLRALATHWHIVPGKP